MEQVAYEDFKKLDLRIGEIIEVTDHPKADKLYVLHIDIGDELREIVAGIKPYYVKEKLKGKKVVVVINLQPAVFRGVTSQGMLLAAQEGEKVVLLTTEHVIGNGAMIR